jgi:hypothetical protein
MRVTGVVSIGVGGLEYYLLAALAGGGAREGGGGGWTGGGGGLLRGGHGGGRKADELLGNVLILQYNAHVPADVDAVWAGGLVSIEVWVLGS